MSGTTFLMKGATGIRYHGSHSRTKLEIRGQIGMSGPQPVGDDGGVPELVHQLFQQFPHLQQVALGAEAFGVVYQRMKDEPTPSGAGGTQEPKRRTRDVAGILHFLTPQQMAEEIVRLDAGIDLLRTRGVGGPEHG